MSRYANTNTLFLEPKVEQYGSHMVMSNVHKPSKIKLINIDTIFSDEMNNYGQKYATPQKYSFILPENITGVKSMQILSAEIPVSFYSITALLGNHMFVVMLGDGSNMAFNIKIPDGNYTIEELALTINTEMKNSGLSSLKFDISKSHSRFTNTGSSGYTILFDIYSSTENHSYKSKLGWILGFRKTSLKILPASETEVEIIEVSDAFINLNTNQYLYIVLDEYTNGFVNSMSSPMDNSLLNKKIISRVAINKRLFPFGTISQSHIKDGTLVSDIRHYSGNIDFHRLTVQLVNCFGMVIDLNGIGMSFIIQVEYE
jgi:hypothetical protein